MTRQAIYITFFEIPLYRDRGWQIKPLAGNHGRYSCLAVRDVTLRQRIREVIAEDPWRTICMALLLVALLLPLIQPEWVF